MLRTHRTLRIEPLDRRNLLAVTPVGLLMADAPPPGGESTLVADALTVPYTEGRVPHTEERSFDEINTPELINGPANGFNPGEFEQLPGGELGEKLPLPDGVDPSKLHGWGCPAGQEPDRNDVDEWRAWRRGERGSNISDRLGVWDQHPGTAEKVHTATGRGFVTANPFGDTMFVYDPQAYAPRFKGGKGDGGKGDDGGGTGGKDTDTAEVKDNDTDVKEKPVDEQGACTKPIGKDPEPEGDDPDELFFPGAGEAAQSETSPIGTSPSGEYEPGEDDPWARHRAEIQGTGPKVDPEDGGPDEAGNPAGAATDAIDAAFVSAYANYPEPDDPDGPTDPRASEGNLTCAVSINDQAASNNGTPPVDDGDGGGGNPIGPEY